MASSTHLNVGIDLGTSRSSISASNGVRHVVESYVGWPLDMVARKVLKRDVLIGEEALENRPMLDLHRPLERGLIKEGSEKDEEAVRELLRHLLDLAMKNGDGDDGAKVRAVVGVPAAALRVNKQNLRKAMDGLVDRLMIVSEPFAVAYGLEALLHSLIIDVGAGTTDFCVMNGRYPTEEDQKTLTVAGDSVDEQLYTLVRERYPEATISRFMVRNWKEQHSFVGDYKGKLEVEVPIQGKPTTIDITREMKAACESLLAPLTETMIDLISRVEPEYQAKVRNNVVLSGGTGLIGGLGSALERALAEIGGGKVRVIQDPVYVGSDGGLSIATDAPTSDWEKLGV
ncbi:MAG TPA: rod shape-determining protein [Thermoanaerobaculia bacterium]|nr:rod shape-determining protein [Thermoanaerobaculia bacterium]